MAEDSYDLRDCFESEKMVEKDTRVNIRYEDSVLW